MDKQAKKTESKTFTQEEVTKILEDQKSELREKAVDTLMQKNADIKQDLLSSGADEFYNIAKWEVMKKMAEDMVKSGALPTGDNAYTVIMKMQAGREMGMKPMESINALYVVKGVITIWGKATTRRIRDHGWRISYIDKPTECTATIKKGDEVYSDTFKFESAEKSGFTVDNYGKLKVGWREGANREQKLRYNVLSKIIKSYVPEVLGSAADIVEVVEDTIPLYAKNGDTQQTLPDNDEPADEKLIATIYSLGGTIPSNSGQLTKGQAKAMIQELAKKKK